MKIIRYNTINDITIEFQDEYKYTTNTIYQNFKLGQIKNPYDRSLYGVGFLGEETITHFVNNKCIPSYGAWANMLERCYNEKLRHKHLAYKDCKVCKEWQNYQVFRKWYDENFYDIGEGRMHIDKDILVMGNKIYSPDTCMFVPQRINMIFMKKNRSVDPDLPQGIRRCVGGYMVSYNTRYLGVHKTLEEALYFYNIEKRSHILKIAEEYKDRIPKKVYRALVNWNVKIAA